MTTLSFTEENYLKAIFKIGVENGEQEAGTNDLATALNLKPASVNEMLKRLSEKDLVVYKKYEKTKLTPEGTTIAKDVIRKHRLWETFLYEKLDFSWDEVHEVAEELEHIHSKKLINGLDKFLGHPKFDPHGDPIPDKDGKIERRTKQLLSAIEVGETCKMVSVKDNSSVFLQYVASLGLRLNNQIKIIDRQGFDGLTTIEVNGEKKTVSQKFTNNIYVI
ncbi:metal-dependent transcriptional regulator [Flavobacteriaceae bacterium Ap0902]|nr:metal-dependent transcriptional regulator [Flavobacteriaceae bacterium Ap0902]